MSKISLLFRWLSLSLVTSTLVVACNQQPNTTTSGTQPSAPLVSATYAWIGYTGHDVAVKKGFFAQEGLNIQDKFFPTGSEEITALLAGKLDIAWSTSGDAIQAIDKDPSLKIIYLVDYSDGADGILARNVATPKEAKGKSLARENLLFEKVLLQAYLKQGGLTEKDLKVQDMPAPDAGTAFATKKVDMAVTFEPFLTKNAKLGGGKVVFSTKDTNLIADVIVVKDKLIQTRKKDLQAYLRAVDKAVKLINKADPEAIKIAAEKLGIKPEEIKEQLAGAKLFDLDANKAMGFQKDNPKSLIGNLEITTKAAEEFKLISKPIKVESLYDDSIVLTK